LVGVSTYHARRGGVEGVHAAKLPRDLLLATLGGDTTYGFNEQRTFDLIYGIAASTQGADYSLAPLVEILGDDHPTSLPLLGWTLLLLSRILANNKRTSNHANHANHANHPNHPNHANSPNHPNHPNPQVHPRSTCSITSMAPIHGTRYYCVTRPHFNLSEQAWLDPENDALLWDDVFIKLRRPMPLPPVGQQSEEGEEGEEGEMSDEEASESSEGPLLPLFHFEDGRNAFEQFKGETKSNHVQAENKCFDPTVLHRGVRCDNETCNSMNHEIRGIRFMSVTDDSYNLCEDCEQLGVADARVPVPVLLALRRPLSHNTR